MPSIFQSFLQAGFECSTHKLANGARLDLIASTQHDLFPSEDYARLRDLGILTVREGLRWTLIENIPGKLDFRTVLPFIEAAREHEIEILWDLLHFGWPDHLDIFSASWVEAFENFAYGFARLLRDECPPPYFITPINEIAFMAWGGGDVACLHPYERNRGAELKRQLVRGALAAGKAVRGVLPGATIVSPEPVIHIVGRPNVPGDACDAERYRTSMFESWDMLLGRLHPELGGSEGQIDVIGLNYYDRNQWRNFGETIRRGDPEYRPFHDILCEVFERYRRPLFVSETGTEGADRPAWFAYISQEVRRAVEKGIPVQGICLYPILNHPGWEDNRDCLNGLWGYASNMGSRPVYEPLAEEIRKQENIRRNGDMTSTFTEDKQGSLEDLVCYSHLRWGFVFQRPQHLMSRFARHRRVFFIEEFIREDCAEPKMRVQVCQTSGVIVVVPVLPHNTSPGDSTKMVAQLITKLFRDKNIQEHIAWYYTPMALDWTDSLEPKAIIYDCMDELSLFQNAPPELRQNEQKLFQRADLVFTGGVSLFEAKQKQHHSVHAFPSSVDCAHFNKARILDDSADDQKNIGRPRLGYTGVIDERIDIEMIRAIAERRPEWQIVMIGPVVKIDPATLPQGPNIHWLGMKTYNELPTYLAGWDVALMPFAMNDSTRYISPTKTPEYLAAGLPVVSTPIRDVEREYGKRGLVRIEGTADGFIAAIEQALTDGMSPEARERADAFLSTLSWDRTWNAMNQLIVEVAAPEAEAVPV